MKMYCLIVKRGGWMYIRGHYDDAASARFAAKKVAAAFQKETQRGAKARVYLYQYAGQADK